MTVLGVLFGAALALATAIALGRAMLAPVREQLYREEQTPLGLLLGAAVLHLAVFATFALGIGSRWVHLALCAAILAATAQVAWKPAPRRFPPLAAGLRGLFWVSYIPFGIYCFVHAMAPEVSSDGVTYHLSLVRRYLRTGSFDHITTNIYANLSQGLEMLFAVAYGWGRHSAATLVHCGFLLALPWLVLGWARRTGKPAAGLGAALIVFTSPVFGITGVSAYNDVATAYAIFGVFYLLHIWEQQRGWRWLLATGLAAGYCFAVKYTAFLALPAALAFVLGKARRWKPAAVVAGAALVLIVPWLVKNWLTVDNPVSPFGNRWFPNPYVSVKFEDDYRSYMSTYGLPSRWAIPLEVTVRGAALSGTLGWIFLLSPLGLLSVRDRFGARLAAAAALFALPFLANLGTRFLMPAAVFAALALCWTLGAWKRWLPLLAAALCAVSCWPPVLSRWTHKYAWRLTEFPWRAALRIEPQDAYLTRRLGLYPEVRMIDHHTPRGARILAMNGVAEAYTDRDIVIGFQSNYGSIATDLFYCAAFPEFAPAKEARFRIGRPVRGLRLRQEGTGDGQELWSVAELRVFRAGLEVPRAPEWRIRARPNPWDIGLAFDNDPVTRWRSNEALAPGQWIEVDFGGEIALDEVSVQYAHDQRGHRLLLDTRSGDGWRQGIAGLETVIPTPAGLQQAATRALKDLGIDYLQLDDGDFGATAVRAEPELWNLELAAQERESRLYRILWPRGRPLTRALPTREDRGERQ
jgi:hypothetical protein